MDLETRAWEFRVQARRLEVTDNGDRADISWALAASQELSKTLHAGWTMSHYKVMWERLPSPQPKDGNQDSQKGGGEARGLELEYTGDKTMGWRAREMAQ